MRPSSPSSVRGIAQATLKIGFFSSDQLGGQSEYGAARGGGPPGPLDRATAWDDDRLDWARSMALTMALTSRAPGRTRIASSAVGGPQFVRPWNRL